MFIAGLTFILCSILFIMEGNTVCAVIGGVGCVLGYMLLIMHYVVSQGEIANIKTRITKLEKKMENNNDEKTAM